ncbi:hypothetical protein [uncultured Clostridium sp.]|uniref:hypothetical protein n=1 Tax=uncultured Clostridium sp. TaxID=59620 RepID=UPI0028F03932|nr:hypothetical protein [uncultured Clostridium sp.]
MSLPKYIVNFEELTDELKKRLLELIDDELRDKYPQLDTNNIEALLEDIKELLPSVKYEGLKNKIENLVLYKHEGKPKIEGRLLDIPPITKENKAEFKFDKDVFLTGIHFNQTGWKKEDRWDLIIDKNKIINKSTIKEIGEHKYFSTFLEVNANTPVSFILHNNSGNSRQTMLDLEYIEGTKGTEVIEPPKNPDIEDIPNLWDIAIRMQWENNSPADIDLHAVMGKIHVYFGNKEKNNLYLNFDYVEHITNNNPEIISVKGNKNKRLKIYVNNYNGVMLNETVEIKIYQKKNYGNKLLKTYNLSVGVDRLKAHGVCEIDLKTLEIIEIDDEDIRLLGGR